tara:strand:- start:893 stop:1042 length:150 start_codon:yes stop_codon:yes gene_type:complete
MQKEKYRITYETNDIQKVFDCLTMDELLYKMIDIKIKKWTLVKIVNLYN